MEQKRNPPREDVRRYCIANDLFKGGTNDQYERMFDMLDRQMPIHDIATVIWVCSPDTDKHAAEIERDLIAIAEDHYSIGSGKAGDNNADTHNPDMCP